MGNYSWKGTFSYLILDKPYDRFVTWLIKEWNIFYPWKRKFETIEKVFFSFCNRIMNAYSFKNDWRPLHKTLIKAIKVKNKMFSIWNSIHNNERKAGMKKTNCYNVRWKFTLWRWGHDGYHWTWWLNWNDNECVTLILMNQLLIWERMDVSRIFKEKNLTINLLNDVQRIISIDRKMILISLGRKI